METQTQNTFFAPTLYLPNVALAMDFYKKAFDAKELRRWSNSDGSIHVSEMEIEGALFHIHEEVSRDKNFGPLTLGGASVIIGLFVHDPDAMMARAIEADAVVLSPMQNYDYGYRQGTVIDPFGHHWTIEKKIEC